jgi:hypothetical protein
MQLIILIAQAGISTGGARVIQLALAPVFLLTGIAGLLNVMTGRLARIVDRGRHLWDALGDDTAKPPHKSASYLRTLERRRRLASMAIVSCTFAALLVCMVIVVLFAETLLELPLKWLEGILFTGSTLALVVGLTYFLREVHLANLSVRLEIEVGAAPDPARDSGSGSSSHTR